MKYLVWCPEYGGTRDDARTIDAFCASKAAELWAEHEDRTSADYLIVKGNCAVVHVSREDDPTTTSVFRVYGETVPRYSAIWVSK